MARKTETRISSRAKLIVDNSIEIPILPHMREIVKVRAASNGEITVAIPRDIRAVVPLKAGDKVLLTARMGQITLTPEKPDGSKKSKSKNR